MNEHESSSPESPAKEQPGEAAAMVKRLREHRNWETASLLMHEAAAMIEKLWQGWIPVDTTICGYHASKERELTQAQARCAELEKDAARYKWMAENWAYADGCIFFEGFNLGPLATLDAAIDAALKEPR